MEVIFLPWGHLAMSGNFEDYHSLGLGLLLASSGQRSGMLLNIFQCTGQTPQQRIIQLEMSVVPSRVSGVSVRVCVWVYV